MNLDKLDAAIAYIEAHPEQHKQDSWLYRGDGGCGTSACLAGWIAILDGWKPARWEAYGDGSESTALAEKDGRVEMVDDAAFEVLGVARHPGFAYAPFEYEIVEMFEAGNTLARIKSMRDDLAAKLQDEHVPTAGVSL